MLLQHGRQRAKNKEKRQTCQSEAAGRPYDGPVSGAVDKGYAEERAGSKGHCRTHAEQTDAESVIFPRHNIGYDRSCRGSRHSYGNAGEKSLQEKQRKRFRQQRRGNASRKQQQSGQQHGAAAEEGKETSRSKASGKTAYDHDAAGQPRHAQTCSIGFTHMERTGHKKHIIGSHHKKIDGRNDIETAMENGPQTILPERTSTGIQHICLR